ncbi:HD domain-containing protein [Vibrio tubiashii]|uniref:HD domain-containing protein n=1 Tax=Vibrio tubiashii TaxID=29498 RepID=A0AAE5GQX6_9VIBR|nr:HD domain-containing phosphohydrolase [Vibrio tubiashii]NOI81112.1 HD domain-containing protein [Vibrio tubiashii]
MTAKRLTLPIHVHLATVIILVVILASVIQIGLASRGLSTLIVEANNKIFTRVAAETRHQLNHHYKTAFSALGTYSKSHALHEVAELASQQLLPEIAHLLEEFEHVNAYSFYYPSGDFFSVMRIRDPVMRQRIAASASARYVLTVSNDLSSQIQIMSQELKVLETRPNDKRILYKTSSWFEQANQSTNLISKPLLLPGPESLGLKIYRQSSSGVIISADVLLDDLRRSLSDTLTNDSSLRVLYNDAGQILALSDSAQPPTSSQGVITHIEMVTNQVVPHAIEENAERGQLGEFEYNNEQWIGQIVTIRPLNSEHVHLLMASKANALFNKGALIKQQTLYGSLLVLILMIPMIYVISKFISKPIQRATEKAKDIEGFKLDSGALERSVIREIQQLNDAQMSTQTTIRQFVSLTHKIAREDNLDDMLSMVCREVAQAVEAQGVLLYLLDTEVKCLVPSMLWCDQGNSSDISASPIPVSEATRFVREIFVAKQTATFTVDEVPHLKLPLFYDRCEVICIPIKGRSGEVVGSLGLLYPYANASRHYAQYADYLQTLLGFTSVAIETHDMLDTQKALLDSFIQVFAGSLDKKSPYTGHHCQRVPVITEWLTQAAEDSKIEAFQHFSLTSEQWEELKMASWLHDCGKITTPEHVVDKATKLETIYNRIHEIRMRFEVLKRDHEIDILRQNASKLSEEQREKLDQVHRDIDADFAFIAEMNLGAEFVSDSDLERLERIASRTWTRTLSKTAGLSWVEKQRYPKTDTLPVKEGLLSDKPEHLIPWDFPPTNEARFTMKPTEYQANQGEMYNLSIRRGTLADEERFIINDHIIQTIKILESLPFPKHMRGVAAIAGGHHERMDGKGYPMGLVKEQMPITARIMAIADVFEALTSTDRPYKKAKSLSESIEIMSHMVNNQHLDADLFALFLSSGVYLRFANQFMRADQIDGVDVERYLDRVERPQH